MHVFQKNILPQSLFLKWQTSRPWNLSFAITVKTTTPTCWRFFEPILSVASLYKCLPFFSNLFLGSSGWKNWNCATVWMQWTCCVHKKILPTFFPIWKFPIISLNITLLNYRLLYCKGFFFQKLSKLPNQQPKYNMMLVSPFIAQLSALEIHGILMLQMFYK